MAKLNLPTQRSDKMKRIKIFTSASILLIFFCLAFCTCHAHAVTQANTWNTDVSLGLFYGTAVTVKGSNLGNSTIWVKCVTHGNVGVFHSLSAKAPAFTFDWARYGYGETTIACFAVNSAKTNQISMNKLDIIGYNKKAAVPVMKYRANTPANSAVGKTPGKLVLDGSAINYDATPLLMGFRMITNNELKLITPKQDLRRRYAYYPTNAVITYLDPNLYDCAAVEGFTLINEGTYHPTFPSGYFMTIGAKSEVSCTAGFTAGLIAYGIDNVSAQINEPYSQTGIDTTGFILWDK
jgi:hypothetical protein